MKIKLADLLGCLEIAADVADQYDRYVFPSTHPRTTDDMLWICSTYLEKRIEVVELDIDAAGRSVKAVYTARQDGSYVIGLLSGMSHDEQRFVLCKEIFHVLLDNIECRNLNLYDHVATTLTESDALANKASATEELAVIGAMEFLFPHSTREATLDSNEGEIDYAALASRYNIPLRHIEHAFDPGTIELFRQVMPMLVGNGDD